MDSTRETERKIPANGWPLERPWGVGESQSPKPGSDGGFNGFTSNQSCHADGDDLRERLAVPFIILRLDGVICDRLRKTKGCLELLDDVVLGALSGLHFRHALLKPIDFIANSLELALLHGVELLNCFDGACNCSDHGIVALVKEVAEFIAGDEDRQVHRLVGGSFNGAALGGHDEKCA